MKRILFFALFFTSCVYSFKGFVKENYSKIYIPVFENSSEKAGIEATVTEEFINYWDEDGRIEIRDEESSTMILRGFITNYSIEPYEYQEDGSILSYRVILKVEFDLIDRTKNEKVWQRKAFGSWGKYEAEDETEDDGLVRASTELARKVLEAYLQAAK